jgi:hypothetical protein
MLVRFKPEMLRDELLTLVLFRRHQLSNTFATNLPYGPYGISPSQVLLEAEPHR